jgi:hypothetical protein
LLEAGLAYQARDGTLSARMAVGESTYSRRLVILPEPEQISSPLMARFLADRGLRAA